jgi:predicted CopG family antitoxin
VFPIILIFFIFVIVITDLPIVTISISEEVRRELLRIAGILQSRTQRRIGYEDVIRYLIRKSSKDEGLLRSACKPIDLPIDELIQELRKGREEDRVGERHLEGV